MEPRIRAAASIEQAKIELDRALAEIDTIQTFNSSLVGLVAHALSNYITVTAATVELLQMSLRDHPDTEVPIWLEGIGRTATLMQHSISRLVAMSGPGDFPLRLDPVSLPILMGRACDYYRRQLTAEEAHITCRAVGHVPLAWADRVALAVVADNLLSNAVKAAKAAGTIRVQVTSESGHVVCSVRDSGSGFTPQQLAGIFQARPATVAAPEAPAPDFGLAIARDFVRRMDGDLWCESEPGRGTCVSFRLPAIE